MLVVPWPRNHLSDNVYSFFPSQTVGLLERKGWKYRKIDGWKVKVRDRKRDRKSERQTGRTGERTKVKAFLPFLQLENSRLYILPIS